jgi:hypothetical protein
MRRAGLPTDRFERRGLLARSATYLPLNPWKLNSRLRLRLANVQGSGCGKLSN